MTTEVQDPQVPLPKGKTTRVVGTIMKEPEQKTSKAGNTYLQFPIIVSTGIDGQDVWWNAKVMENLAVKLPKELFRKFRYAKFCGIGSRRPYEKEGVSLMSNDLLVSGVELQDGEFVKADREGDAF